MRSAPSITWQMLDFTISMPSYDPCTPTAAVYANPVRGSLTHAMNGRSSRRARCDELPICSQKITHPRKSTMHRKLGEPPSSAVSRRISAPPTSCSTPTTCRGSAMRSTASKSKASAIPRTWPRASANDFSRHAGGGRSRTSPIRSTHGARHALASKGSAKYCVSRATLSPLNSMMLTVWEGFAS